MFKNKQSLPFEYEMYQVAGTYAKLAREPRVQSRLLRRAA